MLADIRFASHAHTFSKLNQYIMFHGALFGMDRITREQNLLLQLV